MAGTTFTYSGTGAQNALNKIKSALTPLVQDQVVSRVARVVKDRLVGITPKKWTGQTKRGWAIAKTGDSSYTVFNNLKVMRFLERGTPAHGPVKAKMLFIPLTRKAALAGASGVIANPKAFKWGRDYIFTKWVKGITALRLVERYTPFANATLRAAMKVKVQQILRS